MLDDRRQRDHGQSRRNLSTVRTRAADALPGDRRFRFDAGGLRTWPRSDCQSTWQAARRRQSWCFTRSSRTAAVSGAYIPPPVVAPRLPGFTTSESSPAGILATDDLIARGTLSRPLAELLWRDRDSAAGKRCSSAAELHGTGKIHGPQCACALAASIPDDQRIVVIEDTGELGGGGGEPAICLRARLTLSRSLYYVRRSDEVHLHEVRCRPDRRSSWGRCAAWRRRDAASIPS